MSGTATPKPCRVEWPPLDGDIIGAFLQRDAGGSRTHGMRFCRPPPRHVTSASSSQCPCQGSNLVYDFRKVACIRHTPETKPKCTNADCLQAASRLPTILIPRRGIEPRPTASKAVMHPPHPQGIFTTADPTRRLTNLVYLFQLH